MTPAVNLLVVVWRWRSACCSAWCRRGAGWFREPTLPEATVMTIGLSLDTLKEAMGRRTATCSCGAANSARRHVVSADE